MSRDVLGEINDGDDDVSCSKSTRHGYDNYFASRASFETESTAVRQGGLTMSVVSCYCHDKACRRHNAPLKWGLRPDVVETARVGKSIKDKGLANAKRPCDCRVLCLRLKSSLCSCANSISDMTSFGCRDQGRDSVCPVL